jgi:hypothetical protein
MKRKLNKTRISKSPRRRNLGGLFVIFSLIILFVFLYRQNTNTDLRKSLDLAGKNREQLEKVLDYYSKPQDSLKRKAAVFLIKNMYIHYGYYGKDVEQYNTLFDILDTLNHKQTEPILSQSKHIYDSITANFTISNYIRESDCKIITSEYLINNIEFAFNAWKQMQWKKDVDFDVFCEYILPYRVRNEKLECWRPKFYGDYTELAMKCKNAKNMPEIYTYMRDNLNYSFKLAIELDKYYPFDQNISDLNKGRIGSCPNQCSFGIAAMRAAGLPVGMDYIPNWGDMSSKHSMVHLISKKTQSKRITNENSPINTSDIIDASMDLSEIGKVLPSSKLPEGLYVQYNKTTPKIYRYTYSVQPEMENVLDVKDKSEIAPEFDKLNIKDVSNEYLSCSTVSVKLNPRFGKHQIAYLCVFTFDGWVPVALTKISKDGKALFKNMGRKIMYLPAVYENNEYIPVEYPFNIDTLNKVKRLIPLPAKKQNVRLIRKYHLFAYTAGHSVKLMGGRFEGSNSPNFSNAQLLYEIDYYPFYMNQKVINCNKSFRYLRYVPPMGSVGNIAEVEFHGIKGRDTLLLKGTVIGEPGSDKQHDVAKAFDQNMDTYYENVVSDGWVGMDLGAGNRQRVTKIRFCPRNDTNCIMPGNDYELFYWNNQWISLGRQKADKAYLIYNNVPTGALFWLKCLNGGHEERIFTYEKRMQIWW